MNTVRQALRGALIDGARPADALRRANRVLLRSENPGIVTAIVGIIDPATLQFRYAGAGHPPPLLANSDDTCLTLPGGTATGIALGAVPHHVTSEDVIAVPVDGLLALYTDGCLRGSRRSGRHRGAGRRAGRSTQTAGRGKPALAIDRARVRAARAHDRCDDLHDRSRKPVLAHLD